MTSFDSDIATLRSSGHFDEEWYVRRYPDVEVLGMDPVRHYLWIGAALGRDPSERFSTNGYLRVNSDVAAAGKNPLLHFVEAGQYENRIAPSPADTRPWQPTEATFVERIIQPPLLEKPVRMIAFYLPQFHAIAENDAWWGEGFTEWTNVKPAQPQFIGHYQPHVPHEDIGYYDLSTTDVQHKQIALARQYGIEGFCFYYYWFAGKRLLEKPVDNYLADRSLDHPFCLCWANENWSRRWDGLESEILLAQDHSPDDDLGCITDLARYIRDPRYIRIDGKPLVMIYRPSLLPAAKETAERWRKWCRENGIGEIYLAYTQSFEKEDPANFGFDAAIEFPPNNSGPPDLTSQVVTTNRSFSGKVFDWDIFLHRSENYEVPSYKLFRSVCPGWDNTARRKAAGTCFVNHTPEKYERWLSNAITDTVKRFPSAEERIVFVNAWNEWAEGAHLEPDCRNGYAYLEATRRALEGAGPNLPTKTMKADSNSNRVVIVSHDAYLHGAQYLALNLARICSQELGYTVDMIVLGDGPLKAEFSRWATVHDLAGVDPYGEAAFELATRLHGAGAKHAICNTTVSGRIVPTLKRAGFEITSLIHELPDVIRQYDLHRETEIIADCANRIVFPAEAVAEGFETFSKVPKAKRKIKPQGLYKTNPLGRGEAQRQAARIAIRREHGLQQGCPVVLGVGYADKRKGFDLFVQSGLKLLESVPDAHFIWLGNDAEADWMTAAKAPAVAAGVIDHFIMPGFSKDTNKYYAGCDVFALTSREDPFPSVVLESLDCGIPVVGFSGTGGMGSLIERAGGLMVPSFDTNAFAAALRRALVDSELRALAGTSGPQIIDSEFNFRRYVHDLLSAGDSAALRVSVVVPNYNYARYIADRLHSIRDQTYPPYELIVLDDCSKDDSLERIFAAVASYKIPVQVVPNTSNSGSVFKQWLRGVEMAQGDLIWIAEADDLADRDFLAQLVPNFSDPSVVLAYCQSRQIDGDGNVMCDNYLDYVSDLGAERWTRPYIAHNLEEIREGLFLKNVIPNVSAVLFRRQALMEVLIEHGEEIMSYRNAGDWVAYIRTHEKGAIAFNPQSLNSHRRHANSVTIGNSNKLHLDEIVKVQREAISRYDLGSDAMLRANDYARKVAEHFGIEPPN